MPSLSDDLRYADSARLLAETLQAFSPVERVSIAEYAAAHRWLANEGGGHVGRWRNEETPYLVAPMECATALDWLTVVLVGPGQCGKTEVAQNWLLSSVENDPADMLWYMQTDEGVTSFVKSRINPMIQAHEEMRRRQGPRAVDDSVHFKRFEGMRVEFLSAVMSNLINKGAPRIVADEVDNYPANLGDVMALLDVRRQTYGAESKVMAISHCDRAASLKPEEWNAGIMAIYKDSDRRWWAWQCPQCGAWSSPCPIAPRLMILHYPADADLDTVEREARLMCPVNGCAIKDHERRAMNRTGKWIGLGQELAEDGTVTGQLIRRRAAGFWIVGVMSPFILGGIGGLARALVKAEREAAVSGDNETLRNVVTKQLGVPFTPPKAVGSIDAETLALRAEPDLILGKVPHGVRFLTAAIDVQHAYFEVLVRGWGEGGESWIVDHFRVLASPATDPRCWDALLGDLIGRRYPLADNSGRGMAVHAIGYDSSGEPGVTSQAYASWRRLRDPKNRRIRFFGKVDGRDVFSVLPLKGADGLRSLRLSVVYPDSARKDRKVIKTGTVPVGLFGANGFKDDLAGQLVTAAPGPGFIHFPAHLKGSGDGKSLERPHLFFEQIVAEKRDDMGRWTREHQGVRNEALDLCVMTHVVAHLHGLARMDWKQPRPWAAEWDKNTGVSGGAVVAPVASATADPARPAPAAPGPAAGKPSLIDRMMPR